MWLLIASVCMSAGGGIVCKRQPIDVFILHRDCIHAGLTLTDESQFECKWQPLPRRRPL
jgi:hypothetical protein